MSTTSEQDNLAALERGLGVCFGDRGLLRAALTHRSYLNEVNSIDCEGNERLEFLGDAILDFVTGDFLYHRLGEAQEGELTAVRAALVCDSALARYARALDLGGHLLLGRGEEAAGGRRRPALMGDAFEAVVGAIYVDQGLAVAGAFLMRFLEPELAAVLKEKRTKDAKSRFQELVQHRWQITPHYLTVGESGPDHAKRFVVQVFVGDEAWGTGEGPSKAIAARRAAAAALQRLAPTGDAPTLEPDGIPAAGARTADR